MSGIIRAAKAPKLATIGEYNDAIKAQDSMIEKEMQIMREETGKRAQEEMKKREK